MCRGSVSTKNHVVLMALLISSLIVDKFGTTSTGLIFNGLIVFGAVLVAMANSFWTMFVGRFLLGKLRQLTAAF